ncbi:MAG: ASKHA domain-containing protein [Dehalococcoidia bacterium]|nr:ASKHA domain-containing protein [Dehalococcoidia bacterium]
MPVRSEAESYTIEFQPVGIHGHCPAGKSLLDCARQLGVGINSVCGGAGTCGNCRVRVLNGHVSPVTTQEHGYLSPSDLKNGWRLACQTYPAGNIKIEIPPESLSAPQRTQVEGLHVEVRPDPVVDSYRVSMTPPSLTDMLGDADRVVQTLNKQLVKPCTLVDFTVLRQLSMRVRELGWECQVAVRSEELIALDRYPSRRVGLAVDLGTTKIAAYLVDLDSGKTLAKRGATNPQVGFGDDIISRLSSAMKSADAAHQLQETVVRSLNSMIEEMCRETGTQPGQVLETVLVGNTAMHHLFLGLAVDQLSRSPFVPAVSSAIDVKASNLGLRITPGGYVHLLPNIAGFVGADHVAVLVATKPWRYRKGAVLTIDIGTNTEVSLSQGGKITAVSCASGPAFEGGHIRHGMRAMPGAIERVRISDGTIQYQTIDGAPPIGICGSGILDSLAEMYRAGIVDERGRIQTSHRWVRDGGNGREFVLVEAKGDNREIVITQGDVRELQLAKAAIRTGILALLENAGLREEEITRVIVAGAFGSYIDIASAISIGMLPSLPLRRYRQVGNAAGTGARLALLSRKERKRAQDIAARTHYLELAGVPGFTQTLAETTHLGKYRISRGKKSPL